jgi:hypothetical protein
MHKLSGAVFVGWADACLSKMVKFSTIEIILSENHTFDEISNQKAVENQNSSVHT